MANVFEIRLENTPRIQRNKVTRINVFFQLIFSRLNYHAIHVNAFDNIRY